MAGKKKAALSPEELAAIADEKQKVADLRVQLLSVCVTVPDFIKNEAGVVAVRHWKAAMLRARRAARSSSSTLATMTKVGNALNEASKPS